MMRRLMFFLVMLIIVLLSAVIIGNAEAAQDSAPVVIAFGTTTEIVDRSMLSGRRVRIPVMWQAENRPLLANLYFEQVLPDGSAINVELPRAFFPVPLSGTGVVAPIEPPDAAAEIVLRLSLRDLFGPRVYSERQFSLPIADTGDPGSDEGDVPTITRFVAGSAEVNRSQLVDGTARISVEWEVINRPLTANLVFEEVPEPGSRINVELPRENPWVGSSGSGMVAPRLPNSGGQIRLRLRLVDVLTRRVYDQRDALVNLIDDTSPPVIESFVTSTQTIHASALKNRTARVPVSWSVRSRPANSNLVFEQRVPPLDTPYNIELPRTDPLVPSSGSGMTSPIWPGDGHDSIILTLRLIDLNSAATLASAELVVPIVHDDISAAYQTGDVCLQQPYASSNGTAVGSVGRVLDGIGIEGLPLYSQPQGDVIGTLAVGAEFDVLNGPACWQIQTIAPADQYEFRAWLVRAREGNLEGWVEEYGRRNAGSPFYYYELVQDSTPGPAVINHFRADPMLADRAATITLSWDVTNASRVSIQVVRPNGQFGQWFTDLPLVGTLSYRLPEENTERAQFLLSVEDAQGRQLAVQTLDVAVRCPFENGYNGCPATQATIQAAYQTFEHGLMVWRGDLRQIYVLYEGGAYQTFNDTWTESDPVDTGETPRPGLILPARGFGKVWAQQTGVRERIGWATSNEASYNTRIETYFIPRDTVATYLNLPDGRLLVLEREWEIW
jgi:hypothetical protein